MIYEHQDCNPASVGSPFPGGIFISKGTKTQKTIDLILKTYIG